jgi:succinyl-CoA synthetase beta subunit
MFQLFSKDYIPMFQLDVGGGATADQVTEAFKILTAEKNQVRAILVNIFGGIMRCDIIAKGILTAIEKVGINIPLVVRLEGTNSVEARKLLDESGLPLHSFDDFEDAAKKVVELANSTFGEAKKAVEN